MSFQNIDRRRAIKIIAVGLSASLATPTALLAGDAAKNELWHKWEGEVLGALSSIDLQVPDQRFADRLITACVREMQRLESIFSLHQPDSQINRLNTDGVLTNPAPELVALLQLSQRIHQDTDGAFDITVQPLWSLYADHFLDKAKVIKTGPAPHTIKAALALVDQSNLVISEHEILFKKPGMAITLNGIAQGFITDQISKLLKANGIKHVIVDLGEIAAVGRNAKNQPWTVGILNPIAPLQVGAEIELEDLALATSGGYGLEFGQTGADNHLFDPSTGHSPKGYLSVSVVANSAAVADALSTGFSVMPEAKIASVLKRYRKAGALMHRQDGTTGKYGVFPAVREL